VSLWGWIAGSYGLVLAVAALVLPIRRRAVAAVACLSYALASFALGTLGSAFAVQFTAPGLLLLAGYWLSGFFFRDPQPWLERALLDSDAWLFRAAGTAAWLRRAPRWLLEVFEASYAGDYVLIAAGAIVAAQGGIQTTAYYWSVVLAAELSCYAALPFLRSRPPRVLEAGAGDAAAGLESRPARSAGPFRRLNEAILDRASVQANTIPSGHVAGAFAAALGVLPVSGTAAAIFVAIAVLITIAAVIGRYHYAIDCAAGVSVAVAVSLLL
jgi:hypothetical protein